MRHAEAVASAVAPKCLLLQRNASKRRSKQSSCPTCVTAIVRRRHRWMGRAGHHCPAKSQPAWAAGAARGSAAAHRCPSPASTSAPRHSRSCWPRPSSPWWASWQPLPQRRCPRPDQSPGCSVVSIGLMHMSAPGKRIRSAGTFFTSALCQIAVRARALTQMRPRSPLRFDGVSCCLSPMAVLAVSSQMTQRMCGYQCCSGGSSVQ